MYIHLVTNSDVEQLSILMNQLASESSFMLFEPDEVPSPSALARRLVIKKPSEYIWVAEENNNFIAYLGLSLGTMKRSRGVGTIAIGVTYNSSGKGIGSCLMSHVIAEAQKIGLHRLQLHVQTTNHGAIKLYRKFAFEVEGRLRGAVKIDGCLIDKFLMAKLL